MARNLNLDADRDEIARRIDALRPEARPSFGKFDAPGMLGHLIESLRMGSGDLAVKSKNSWLFQRFPIKQLVLYGPWPKGAPTAPELLARTSGDFEADRQEFKRQLQRWAETAGRPRPEHPAFGKLTEAEWGHLSFRHIDHHFRQFGI